MDKSGRAGGYRIAIAATSAALSLTLGAPVALAEEPPADAQVAAASEASAPADASVPEAASVEVAPVASAEAAAVAEVSAVATEVEMAEAGETAAAAPEAEVAEPAAESDADAAASSPDEAGAATEPAAAEQPASEPAAEPATAASEVVSADSTESAVAPAVDPAPVVASAPMLAPAADPAPAVSSVAQVNDVSYTTLDDAVAAVVKQGGGTVDVLGDCATEEGFGIPGISVTINGNGHTINALTKGIYIAKGKTIGELIFNDCTLNIAAAKGTPTVWGEGYGWANVVINYDCVLNFNSCKVDIAAGAGTGVYYHEGSKINLSKTTMTVNGLSSNAFSADVNDKGLPYTSELNIMNGSRLETTHCRSGIVAAMQVTVDNSTLINSSHRGNASNGADYIIRNGSTVEVSNNGYHGMSARNVTVEGSNVTCNGNGCYGITAYGKVAVDGTSAVEVNNNARRAGYGGLRLTKPTTTGSFAAGSQVVIDNNGGNGLENYGTCTFENGAKLEAMHNHESGNGGGVYNAGTLTLPSDAVIYNNAADKAGDDIYVEDGGTITFGAVGSGWKLDHDLDRDYACTDDHLINGWYEDSADARYNAHGKATHIELADPGTKSGPLAIKAAHNFVKVSYVWVTTDNPTDVSKPSDEDKLVPVDSYAVKAQSASKQGYVFDGWYTDAACTQRVNSIEPLTEDTTLYGKWARREATVKYEWVSEDNPTDVKVPVDGNTHHYGDAYTALVQDPSKQGYEFDGWYTDAGCTMKWTDGSKLDADTTSLYGKWTKLPEPAKPEEPVTPVKPAAVKPAAVKPAAVKPSAPVAAPVAVPQTADPTSTAGILQLALAGIATFASGLASKVIRRRK